MARLDGATWAGFALGGLVLVGCVVFGHIPLNILFQPEALIVVLGGTLTALLIHFSTNAIGLAKAGLNRCLFTDELSTDEVVNYLADMAGYVRSEGLLALQPMLDDIHIPFVHMGAKLMLDNRPEDLLHSSLSTEMEVCYRQQMDQARLFEAAGGFAPTMGIIGAVVGLIQVVGAFNTPQELTQGIASAFIATLYGVGLANLFFLPLAGRLRQKSRDAWFQKTIMLEGLMSIYSGDHPSVTEEKLMNFIRAVKPEQASRPAKATSMRRSSGRTNDVIDDSLLMDIEQSSDVIGDDSGLDAIYQSAPAANAYVKNGYASAPKRSARNNRRGGKSRVATLGNLLAEV
jgi:chemotaxis protein MotA